MKNINFKNYFLGMLSVDEAEALEVQIISDVETESQLIQAENDLIEYYLEGNLTEDESKAFLTNFLVSKERLERLELARALRKIPELKPITNPTESIFFERLKALFFVRPFTIAFASIALIFVLGICWKLISNRANVGSETELIALNKQDLSDINQFKDLKNLNLTSDSFRSAGNSNVLSEKDITDRVLVRLILPVKPDAAQEFNVTIQRNGEPQQLIVQRSIGQQLRLLLPKSLLSKGEFQIMLERSGEKYNYYFSVQ